MENYENNNSEEYTNHNEDGEMPPKYDATAEARNKIIFFVIVVVVMIAAKFMMGGQ